MNALFSVCGRFATSFWLYAGHWFVHKGMGALANIELPDELAFPNIQAYIRGAIDLAKNRTRLGELRQELRPRMAASPLYQPEQFARDLKALYGRMWKAYCEGLPCEFGQARAGI